MTSPSITYVLNPASKSNLSVFQDNIRSYSESDRVEEAQTSESKSPPLLISIRKFVFEQGRITADLSSLGLNTIRIDLPAIHETNLGGSEGAPPSHLAIQLSQKFIAKAIVTVSASEIGSQLSRLLRGAVGEAKEKQIKGLFKNLMQK